MSIGKRLKSIRNELSLSQDKFSETLSIHLRSYASYEQDQRPLPQDVILALHYLGYDITWLLTGNGNSRNQLNDFHRSYKVMPTIPLLSNLEQSFNEGIFPLASSQDQEIPNPESCRDPLAYALKVSSLESESMTPFFQSDEIIIVSPSETVMSNDKAVIKLKNGHFLFRVIYIEGTQIRLISANPDYKIMEMDKSNILFAHKVIGTLKG